MVGKTLAPPCWLIFPFGELLRKTLSSPGPGPLFRRVETIFPGKAGARGPGEKPISIQIVHISFSGGHVALPGSANCHLHFAVLVSLWSRLCSVHCCMHNAKSAEFSHSGWGNELRAN